MSSPPSTAPRAEMSIDSQFKIPADASANVHSVSAIGEQYLDLVSTGKPGQYLSDGPDHHRQHGAQRGRAGTGRRPTEGLEVLPKEKIDALLTETAEAVGGLGPALQRLVDSTTAIASDFKDNLGTGQRHHQQLDADPGQPGELGRRHRTVGART